MPSFFMALFEEGRRRLVEQVGEEEASRIIAEQNDKAQVFLDKHLTQSVTYDKDGKEIAVEYGKPKS